MTTKQQQKPNRRVDWVKIGIPIVAKIPEWISKKSNEQLQQRQLEEAI